MGVFGLAPLGAQSSSNLRAEVSETVGRVSEGHRPRAFQKAFCVLFLFLAIFFLTSPLRSVVEEAFSVWMSLLQPDNRLLQWNITYGIDAYA